MLKEKINREYVVAGEITTSGEKVRKGAVAYV